MSEPFDERKEPPQNEAALINSAQKYVLLFGIALDVFFLALIGDPCH